MYVILFGWYFVEFWKIFGRLGWLGGIVFFVGYDVWRFYCDGKYKNCVGKIMF